jgi:uncharacterized protein (DUF2252 family)
MKIIVLPQDRLRLLLQHKNHKMAASAHAYVRGSTRRFYEWLGRSDRSEIPDGPPIWICGDCHVGNLGPVGSGSGTLALQIRDLDQTVIGNPAHDLVRLGLSLGMAARSSDLPGVVTALMIERMVGGYSSAFEPGAEEHRKQDEVPEIVHRAMHAAARRSWKHLADERIEGQAALPIGTRFWPLSREERLEVEKLFKRRDLQDLASSLRDAGRSSKIRVIDSAFWRKGCSSLGRLRIAVLLQVGKGRDKRHCLMDIKEATSAAAPHDQSAHMPADDAERVKQGALALSPFLGSRMVSAHLLGRPVFIRELLPQDLKLEIERLSQDEAVSVAAYLARVVGVAHAGQLNAADRARWLAELGRTRGSPLDAPSWLWDAVVDLVAIHEAAYLQHCRRYALGAASEPDEKGGTGDARNRTTRLGLTTHQRA